MQNVIFGLTTGGVLAAATVGFALIRQTENFLNIAHGQVLALGAYLMVVLHSEGVNVFAALIIAMVAMGLLGVILGATIFKPVAQQGGNVLLFTSIGVAFIIYGGIIAIFGTTLRPIKVGFGSQLTFSVPEFVLLLCLIIFLGSTLAWFLNRRSHRVEQREPSGYWNQLWNSLASGYTLGAFTAASLTLFIVAVATHGMGANSDSLNIRVGELLIVVVPLVLVIALRLFLGLTRLGRWLRAAASNPGLASVRGVPVKKVSAVVWFISSALAAMAGGMIALLSVNVTNTIGWQNILLILSAAVLGGTGSILGAMAAAVLLGVVMDASVLLIPSDYRSVVAFGMLILVLFLKPEGLFSTQRRAEQAA